MTQKTKFSDFTEQEFFTFLQSIMDPEDGISERAHERRIHLFVEISEHPTASDLIYWPEEDGLDTPENIVRIIKEWRTKNGKPGFKPDQSIP